MTTKNDHPQETVEETREVPIVEEDFAKLLQKFKVKPDLATNIAENISHTGGPQVFEDTELLTRRLTAWSGEIAPAKRKLIIEQWFAEKGIAVPPDLIQKAGMTTEQLAKAEAAQESKDQVKYVYDTESRQIRMAKQGEPGGTLEQAKQLKQLAEESEAAAKESPFIPDAQGNLILNPKARITGIELMAYEMIKKAQERGEPLDPLEAMAQAADKMKLYREALGGKGDDTELATLEKLNALGMLKKGSEGGLLETIQSLAALGLIRKPGDEESSGVKSQIAELKKSLDDMQEEAHKQEIARLQLQIVGLAEAHKREMQEILAKMEELGKPRTGRTEMDIIHDIATEGIELIKTEAAGMRGMMREVVSGSGLPAAKSTEEREERKDKYRKALQTDQEIEQIGQRLFFS